MNNLTVGILQLVAKDDGAEPVLNLQKIIAKILIPAVLGFVCHFCKVTGAGWAG